MSSSEDNAGVIAPPPLLYGAALAAGLALDFLVLRVPTGLPVALQFGLATACVLAALVLIGGALTGFRRAGTPAEPWHPSTAIVTSGVYGYTRNPMYVAMALFYGAIAVGPTVSSLSFSWSRFSLWFTTASSCARNDIWRESSATRIAATSSLFGAGSEWNGLGPARGRRSPRHGDSAA